ncbi:hypothetical protein GGI20_005108 [Coemansia sp. BCRC 34301]|nr:hypothetical protein GGI20_005108 [Coemansia sp. BCRC 34301]
MGQAASNAVRRTGGSKLRLPRTTQAVPGSAKTREEMLNEEDAGKDRQLEANLKSFLSPRQHTTMTGMTPAADNTNVRALRQRQAGAQGRVESQHVTGLLRDLARGAEVERVAAERKLDVATVRSLYAFLRPVS